MCKVHPRYKGVRRPLAECFSCWALWFSKPVNVPQLKDFRLALEAYWSKNAAA